MSINLEELERLAKEAGDTPLVGNVLKFKRSLDPDTILTLVRAVRAAIKMNEAGEEVARHADLTAHNNFNDADKELSAALEPFTTEDRT